jgi:hypothetical protein
LHSHHTAADLGNSRVQNGLTTAYDEDRRAFRSEPLCGRQSDPFTTTRNHSHFALQRTTHKITPIMMLTIIDILTLTMMPVIIVKRAFVFHIERITCV